MVVVGASFTAGVGAHGRCHSWPHVLANLVGWKVVVRGDPGAGYVRRGARDAGPLIRLVHHARIRSERPALVVLQAGHNDIGTSLPKLRSHVAEVLRSVRARDPAAHIALITVFPGPERGRRVLETDRTIVSSARHTDPGVLIMDPLVGKWRFPTLSDHLHPTEKGHLIIARRVAHLLAKRGWVQPPSDWRSSAAAERASCGSAKRSLLAAA